MSSAAAGYATRTTTAPTSSAPAPASPSSAATRASTPPPCRRSAARAGTASPSPAFGNPDSAPRRHFAEVRRARQPSRPKGHELPTALSTGAELPVRNHLDELPIRRQMGNPRPPAADRGGAANPP